LFLLLLVGSIAYAACDAHDRRAAPSMKGGNAMPTNDANQPTPTLAMRLIFEYDGDQVRLVSQQPVDLAVTGFDIARSQRPGYYVDARDGHGHTLARVPARGAYSGSLEVFPEQPGEPISRVDVVKPHGAFTVVVPVPDGADHVSVVHVAQPRPDTPGSASRAIGAVPETLEVRELAKFPLHISR
jgi:hypothetical protein